MYENPKQAEVQSQDNSDAVHTSAGVREKDLAAHIKQQWKENGNVKASTTRVRPTQKIDPATLCKEYDGFKPLLVEQGPVLMPPIPPRLPSSKDQSDFHDKKTLDSILKAKEQYEQAYERFRGEISAICSVKDNFNLTIARILAEVPQSDLNYEISLIDFQDLRSNNAA
ncbi:uncharacterized protein B0I36DRAFT_356472 [Microdochium trichocladiopsis]|uniref:Uncharacterized protein n=1 Tax=Microdochium trichocladiopsis TaxID=1682393 RepID=A0A9P8XTE5_9PEZI|nr:uncharacterized protein B0I36DRAFT_356472 [Microdochium trichocladiopsis]KAH7010875.1 hypothetical protein B0I36DRAFT_356472 [Microdochium trichocladiopsis]